MAGQEERSWEETNADPMNKLRVIWAGNPGS